MNVRSRAVFAVFAVAGLWIFPTPGSAATFPGGGEGCAAVGFAAQAGNLSYTTCTYQATRPGAVRASGFWAIEIERGAQTIAHESNDYPLGLAQLPCGVIQPGDRVTAYVAKDGFGQVVVGDPSNSC